MIKGSKETLSVEELSPKFKRDIYCREVAKKRPPSLEKLVSPQYAQYRTLSRRFY